jgi:hypothetical protein
MKFEDIETFNLNVKLHSFDDKPARVSNCSEWRKNGILHREDGPAFVCDDGHKAWVSNNRYHRTNGPAVIHRNGYTEWWINGEGGWGSQGDFNEPPKAYLKKLAELGIKYVRGSDEV